MFSAHTIVEHANSTASVLHPPASLDNFSNIFSQPNLALASRAETSPTKPFKPQREVAMSSGQSNSGAKSLPAASPSYSNSSQPITASSSGFDSSSRRPSGLSSPSLAAPSPRKGQASRKQHRSQRRPLRAYDQPDEDDDMAELVGDLRDQPLTMHDLLMNRRLIVSLMSFAAMLVESSPESIESARPDLHHPPPRLLGTAAAVPGTTPPLSDEPKASCLSWLRLSYRRQG